MTALVLVAIVVLIFIAGTLFVNLSAEFGGKATKQQKHEFAQSSNFQEGRFVNLDRVELHMDLGDMADGLFKFFKKQPNAIPEIDLPIQKIDSLDIVRYDFEKPRIIWFGHSAVLLQISGKNILIDPMFGKVPAPHPWLGIARFSKKLPIEIEKLPQIDAVILSHDHYNHLDYGSIVRLKDKVKAYYVPLGVENHLIAWGIDKNLISTLDWWDEVRLDDLRLVSTPAQHFSGRGLSDRGATLWSSWVILSEKERIYFSGDSGYGTHFKEIGEKYGPFDFAMMECGQYNEQWIEIHMMPEQTAQAAVDVKAKLMMPIHWGAFKLAFHSWTDPVERVTKISKEMGVAITTPIIGEQILWSDYEEFPNSVWWHNR